MTFFHNRAFEEAVRHLPIPKGAAEGTASHDYKDILSQLLSGTTEEDARIELLNVLKHAKAFRNLGSFTGELKQLVGLVNTLKGAELFARLAEAFIQPPQGDAKPALQTLLTSSGLFLEAGIKKMLMEDAAETVSAKPWQRDLKAALLSLMNETARLPKGEGEEANILINRLLFKIDYFQLLSSLSAGTALFVPYHFAALNEGELYLHSGEDRAAYCDLRLDLESYGELKVMFSLEKGRLLTLIFYTENGELTTILRASEAPLRAALARLQLQVEGIRFVDKLPQPERHYTDAKPFSSGLEYKA